MKYVYYDPSTMQVEAEFDTPELSRQANWEARGYSVALVPPILRVTRDHRITKLDPGDLVSEFEVSVNPVQPSPRPTTRIDDLHDKLEADTITDPEIREMLRLERGL